MTYMLRNKVALITGASRGLGREIAIKYVKAGASVIICARNSQQLEETKKDLESLAAGKQKVFAESIDISSESEIREFIDSIYKRIDGIDILVNNAGIYGAKGPIEETDWKEWLHAIEVNLFGSILVSRSVLPYFKEKQAGKIIQLSGGGTTALPYLSAYVISKAAIAKFVETVAEEVREYNIDVNAIAPGGLNTGMLDEILEAGPENVGMDFYKRCLEQQESGGTSLEYGASLAVFLGSDQSNGITGKLISAVWDNWEEWPNHISELSNSDAYTFRRITGRDRGFDWGDK